MQQVEKEEKNTQLFYNLFWRNFAGLLIYYYYSGYPCSLLLCTVVNGTILL